MIDPKTIKIQSTDRVFLCGKTGSGKTYAARRLLSRLHRVVVLDPKGTIVDKPGETWNLVPWDREARRLLRVGDPIRTRVVADIGQPVAEAWEAAFESVLRAGNCTLYIDEVYGVVPPGSNPSPMLTALWTRGRELGIGSWAASQRPSWVPLFCLSEADHFFMFRLTLGDDRRRMSEFMGEEGMQPIQDRHGFLYMHVQEDDEPTYIKELPPAGQSKAVKQVT